ncbi:MAG: DUF1801 domain-containing protein [Bacteroidetes bacterium]|nr:DUF1801 domain-containing protein [Bacteroidota bacterium]
MKKFGSVEEYFASQPAAVQAILEEMRNTISQAAPKAQEVISYNMPAFKMHGVLVYYAAAKEHLGFYPTAEPIRVFADELAKYKTSKGAIQFPLDKPIPKTLIKKIVKYRLEEDEAKAKAKKKG